MTNQDIFNHYLEGRINLLQMQDLLMYQAIIDNKRAYKAIMKRTGYARSNVYRAMELPNLMKIKAIYDRTEALTKPLTNPPCFFCQTPDVTGRIDEWLFCTHCSGNGTVFGVECPDCQGIGKIFKNVAICKICWAKKIS